MDASKTRVFPPARIVALALIAVLAAGLAYLRFNPEDDVSVPAGAKAGDLILERCEYTTEDGPYAADCGTLVVPENRADPRSRLIALPVTRIRARSERPAEPVFLLWGGPGLTNMAWSQASRFAQNRDVVFVGYRGIDGSVQLDCPEVESALKHSTAVLGGKSFRAYAGAFRSCADRLADEGVDLAGYGVAQQIDDMEAARKALGYGRIDLVSESAGTRPAMIYSWRYPESIHRSVMIAVNPPGHFLFDPKTTDEQVARYAELCAKDAACRSRTDDLTAVMRETAIPDRWFGLPIKKDNVRVATLFGLMESSPAAAPLSGPMTLDSWLATGEGDASGMWFQSLFGDILFPRMFVWGEYASVGRLDARAARDYFSSGGQESGSNLGHAASAFIWGGGRLSDSWPAQPDEDEYSRVRTSTVETLLIGGTLDFAAPPQFATKELLPYLPNGHQVVLPAFGHTTTFWEDQKEAGTRLINTFLDSGRVDDSLYKPQPVDFTPEPTMRTIAKIVAVAMAGLALLAVLSLLWWIPRRVQKRGGFGRMAGASLRSLYPVVLGLGGWSLGLLIVITTMKSVSVDNELLAFLGAGVPIGLGIYWAWVRRDASSDTKTRGFAAAIAGALAGAWLGFHAASDLFLITAIAGAIAGANLALIVFDISRARARNRGDHMTARQKRKVTVTVGALLLSLTACVGAGVDNYDEFRWAFDKGASCSELIDQRDGLKGTDRNKATADLVEKGCLGRP